MFRKFIGWLIKFLVKPVDGKLHAKSYFEVKRRGKFNFDTRRIDFLDIETQRRYIIRPIGMPLPVIVDELTTITGSMESAMDIYKKFCTACNNASKKNSAVFKVGIHKLV